MGDRVFAGSCVGRFYAFEIGSGEVAWTHEVGTDDAPANYHGEILVAGNLLVVPSDMARGKPGSLFALDAESGGIRWQVDSPGGFPSDPVLWATWVLAVDSSGNLFGIGLEDGKPMLRIPAVDGEPRSSLRYSVVRTNAGAVWSGPEGHLRCVDPLTAEILWETELHELITTALVAHGDTVYAGTQSGTLVGIDAGTGSVIGELVLGGAPVGIPVVVRDMVLVLAEDLVWIAAETDLSGVRWFRDALPGTHWSGYRPQVRGDEVLLGGSGGTLARVRLEDGEIVGQYAVSGTVRGFRREGHKLWVGTLEGILQAYEIPE